MTLANLKITAFAKKVADLPDKPSGTMTPAQLKTQFDSSPEELRVSLNGLIDALMSVLAGTSGGEQIGSAPITGVTGATIYAQLADLKTQLNQATTGSIPDESLTTAKYADGSITPPKLSFTPALQSALDATNANVAANSVSANVYAYKNMGGL